MLCYVMFYGLPDYHCLWQNVNNSARGMLHDHCITHNVAKMQNDIIMVPVIIVHTAQHNNIFHIHVNSNKLNAH